MEKRARFTYAPKLAELGEAIVNRKMVNKTDTATCVAKYTNSELSKAARSESFGFMVLKAMLRGTGHPDLRFFTSIRKNAKETSLLPDIGCSLGFKWNKLNFISWEQVCPFDCNFSNWSCSHC